MTTRETSSMMTIGRFAQLSGLTVKALRHYDETGLLQPAHVDPETGYRWYRAGQARDGAIISVLRSMGVPLELVRHVVSNPDRSEEHLARWRAQLATDRLREDDAIAAGLVALDSYGRDGSVVRRRVAQQHYVGLPVGAQVFYGDPEAGAAVMQEGWQGLERLIARAGATASSAWTILHPEDGRDAGRAVLCFELEQPWPTDAAAAGYESGTLPARTELAVVLTPDGMPAPRMQPGDGAPPAALIALMDALDRERAAAGTIRQTPMLDAEGGFAGLEISLALEAAPAR